MHIMILKLLLILDYIDLNTTDNKNIMSLSLVTNKKHQEVIKLLLTINDIDLELNNKFCQRMLLCAAENSGKFLLTIVIPAKISKIDSIYVPNISNV